VANLDLKARPDWVWWTLCPVIGGLVIIYISRRDRFTDWEHWGWGLTALGAIALFSAKLIPVLLLVSGGISWLVAMYFKREYLIKHAPRGSILPTDRTMSEFVAKVRGRVDLNKCSKDDLVRELGLPIVYAHDIDLVRSSGYIFTHIEELSDLVGIPDRLCQIIEPLIVFNYYDEDGYQSNWQRLNLLPSSELIELGLEPGIARAIEIERQQSGKFKSIVDVCRRTGLPINHYQALM
jgi:hypothetical protein